VTEAQSPRATFVIGGARSGKSRFAEELAEKSGLEKIYLATGAAHDSEMADRIARHRRQRGSSWSTVEEQTALNRVLQAQCGPGRVVLVDCLTLWLSNLMLSEKDLDGETARLCETVCALTGPCIFVSNEVGMGIVPENRLSRSFRDAQGRLNQDMARVCGQVVFVAAGLPLVMKPSDQPEIDL